MEDCLRGKSDETCLKNNLSMALGAGVGCTAEGGPRLSIQDWNVCALPIQYMTNSMGQLTLSHVPTLIPSKYTVLPDIKTKDNVPLFSQNQKTAPDVTTVESVQAPVSQATAMLSNPKLFPMKYSILPDIKKSVEESNCQINQKERSKVRTPKKLPKGAKSASSKPENKMIWTRLILPMSPAVALKNFQDQLTSLEQKEILEFPEIWYLGLGAEKTKGSQETQDNSSSSHDGTKGIYIPVLRDHIAYRYEILEKLGQGAFGVVLKCLDHKIKEMVALKVIHDMESANHMAHQELEILEVVRREDKGNRFNVIHMKEHMTFRKHLCIAFELEGINLYALMSKSNFQGFTVSQTHHFATGLVTSLQMLHRQKIIHCDLKPENILLSNKAHGNIKVADFGCSFREHQNGSTYVQTRFYRAPEVILGFPFGTAIDMWSLGCVLAELYTGTPLFPGTNEVDQLACIMEVLGMPPGGMVQTAPRRRLFFDSEGHATCLMKRPKSKDLASMLGSRNSLFVDFIRHCLAWDPTERMTADAAGHHQWLQEKAEPWRPLRLTKRGWSHGGRMATGATGVTVIHSPRSYNNQYTQRV
ncbi:hypothetical protein AAFF_G00343120 [Aldrovandia affinis]|uniref:dual-specificity kinase n=1 Tax=Aldrovandia affinis TaxID=143900 RepID=A0AAD7WNZ6_9TELE|nr:hypothetical protein AAFF_G00343120 [Aldrovandia affinis]